MDSEDNLFDTIGETIDSDKLATSSSIIDTQNNSEDEFIVPSSNFGIHWTGFLCSKQVKNTKSYQYNAKCLHCNKIFEAQKETIINYIMNACQKIVAEEKSYPNKDIDMSSKKHLTDFFNKGSISSEKTDELHTLLLKSLIYAKEISKKDQNNQTLNNDSNSDNTNSTELEDYDEMFSSVFNSNNIELETNEFEKIYAEVEQNISNSFLEQLFNFDIEELTLESNEENISTNQIGIACEWTLDEILNKNNA
ncbi:43807_t:CDS:2, partial [Gigaspora margarita]